MTERVPDRTSDRMSADQQRERDRQRDRSPWHWLLVLPLLVTLYPPLYNRRDPVLAGIPFFYWYQLAIISVGVVCTYVVYARTRR